MASHTATGEWKSFEIRMRRRRAERLVLRADVALEAGCFEDARGLLDEARSLWPGVPGLTEVQEKIDKCAVATAAVPAVPVEVVPSRWKEVVAAAATVVFVGAAITLAVGTMIERRLPARDEKAIVDIVPAPAVEIVPASAGTAVATPAIVTSTVTDEPATLDTTPPATPEPVHALASVVNEEPRRAPIQLPADTVTLGSPAPTAPAATPTPIPTPPPTTPPPIVATTGASPPIAIDAAPIQPPQEPLVRGALARYAKAYSDLDVNAAEHVWPSVNRPALERAFDSLASQRVSLGDCRINVDGNSAHASCAGMATWTPKVGGRERTDERHWDFDLEKSAAGWQITSARVQNR